MGCPWFDELTMSGVIKMDGILIVDKPAGMTSHDIVARIRRLTLTKKVGHGGTLDPSATGVLPILIGRATKLSIDVMGGEKEYIVQMKLGEATDTDDSDGNIIETRPVPAGFEDLLNGVLTKFHGVIGQIPPAYSAIKYKGEPLYKLARAGKKVDLPPRKIDIKSIEILDIDTPFVKLNIKCSKGTYVRALVRDIGRELGSAAHVVSLRRTVCGEFKIEDAIPFKEISTLQDIVSVLRRLPNYDIAGRT